MKFDLDQFISDCRDAVRQDDSHKFVREVVARAVENSNDVLRVVGAPMQGAITPIYRSPELTILNVVWART